MAIRHAPLRLRNAGGEVDLVRFLVGRSGTSDARADLSGDGVRASSSIIRRNTGNSDSGFGDGVRMSSRSKGGVGVAGSGARASGRDLAGDGVRASSSIIRRKTYSSDRASVS